ncbi:uncharacterized protein LOC100141915 isoform X2 [Tribolium castaneum]|uniref:uncharacterized protein LOC100141915 isoform X2 n=1 Tax=Tribolium castaneum TaxID=7070 RepID=UPI0001757CD9|nr:PREDICTED: uncharacterized protein LOC100141915 isoform X2 [Tribolium castaneum]|eukprot:XP_015833668.1 PREDICTED: uncharacterized protein LOC100141915 isoform X2 [Tribolium castaneum]
MKGFEDNDCRLCSKTFCCPNCRILHEEKFHNVNPECEICVYGRASLKNASVSLLNHIKTAHWPLHCVFCKKLFTSFDDLLSHDKCPFKLETLKMETTPKTPVTSLTETEKPSPEVTPFYKATEHGALKTRTMGATSTPLIHKDSDKSDKITPINQSEIIYHKSSLKLTGSSNFSDSKKSDRRVTFSETPFVSEMCKKPKYLPLPKQITNENSNVSNDDSTDELELYKTAPHTILECEEKENLDNIGVFNNCDANNDGTLWESALTKLDFSGCNNIIEKIDNKTNNFNVSLQINVFSPPNSPKSKSNDADLSLNKSTNIWSSVTSMVKSVVSNISMTAQSSFCVGLKRPQPDNDALCDAPHLKRMKLTDIKCRRPIRTISPLYQIRLARPRYVDKATQTD